MGDLDRVSRGVAFEKPLGEHGDIGPALAQGRHVHRDHVQAEVEILAESALPVLDLEFAVGSGNHPDVDFHFLVAADRANFFLLQHAQQFGLHLERQFANFVEKNCASAGRLEQAGLGTYRTRESTLFVAKKLALDERRNQRAAIHGHERTAREGSSEVNRAGHELFPRAALAGDQHRRARVLQARDHAQHFLNFGRGADDAVQAGFSVHALPQKLVLLHQADFLRHAAQKQAQLFERREGLADVVVGSQLHRLHRGLDRPVAGHHRDLGAGQ